MAPQGQAIGGHGYQQTRKRSGGFVHALTRQQQVNIRAPLARAQDRFDESGRILHRMIARRHPDDQGARCNPQIADKRIASLFARAEEVAIEPIGDDRHIFRVKAQPLMLCRRRMGVIDDRARPG